MFYCLNDNYLLRGWDKLPSAIVKKFDSQVFFIQPELFSKIRDFNWMLYENSPFLTNDQKLGLSHMKENGIFELRDAPQQLNNDQLYRLYPNRYLQSVHWAVTGSCNCRCRHCYMSSPSGKLGEFTHDECIRIIGQMEEAGIQTVSLSGGEVLIRKDFMEIAERLTQAGIRISTIMTNGILVTENLLHELKDLGQRPKFNMSFDGIGCHDWLRGVDGVEKKVLSAFELCEDNGFPTGAEYCLHRGNTDAFRDSVKLLSSLGCRTLKASAMSIEGEAVHIRDMALTPDEEFRFCLDYLPQYHEDGEPLELMLSGVFMSKGKKNAVIPFERMPEDRDCGNYCLCGHARNKMYLTNDGYIVPCIPIGSIENGRNLFPNIRNMKFTEALNDSFYMSFIDTRLDSYFEQHPECESCEYRNRCAGGCRGLAAESSDLMGRDEKTCAFYKNGWYEKTRKLIEEFYHIS